MQRLKDKVAIVTGAASGIGAEVSRLFAREGARVLAADRNEAGAKNLAEELCREGLEVAPFAVDVTRWQEVDGMVAKAVALWGKLDVMVNNAGIIDDARACGDVEEDLWDRVLAVNLKGVFLGCKRSVQQFLSQKTPGAIVNTASIAGMGAMAGGTAYTASKHGVVGLTRQIACEYANDGIRVNAVCPGVVRTGMTQDYMEFFQPIAAQMIPMGRPAEPTDIAPAFLWLASEESRYVTGSLLVVDGGWRAK